jgi:hypothetical protein
MLVGYAWFSAYLYSQALVTFIENFEDMANLQSYKPHLVDAVETKQDR